MANNLVSVIIVAGGKDGYLDSCLDSLKEQKYTPLEIILIDNSLDLSLNKRITSLYSSVRSYLSKEKLSYCESLNKGIAVSKGDFILCLNDDCTLSRDFINEALRGFYVDTKIGMVTGKILRPDKATIDSTGLFLSYCLNAKERGYGLKDAVQFEKEEYVFGVNGAVAFYRRAMLEDVKDNGMYFDQRLSFFYEDLDISWRAQRKGWKGYYMPFAIAYHVRGGTVRREGGQGKPFSRRFIKDELQADLIKNRYLVMVKNVSWLSLLIHLPGVFCYDFLLWTYYLFCKPKIIASILKQQFTFRGDASLLHNDPC